MTEWKRGKSVASTGKSLTPSTSPASLLDDGRAPPALWARYSITVLLVAAAVAARLAMLPVNGGLAFVTFYPVVISAAMLFGTGPALLAILLGGACGGYLFLPPYGSFGFGVRHALSLATFGLTGGLTCLLAHRMRSAVALLRGSEQRLRGLYEAPHVGFALSDLNGRFIQFNDAFRNISGYSAEELRALHYWELTPKKHEADDARQRELLLRTGQYGPYEKEYARKDGSVVPIRLHGTLLKGNAGERYVWSIFEDITDRKRAEEKLTEAEYRFRMLFEHSVEAIILTDLDGNILDLNPQACRLFGWSHEELRALGGAAVFDPTDPRLAAALDKRKRMGQFRGELMLVRKDGTRLECELSSVTFKNRDGIDLAYIIARDISGRKQLERALLDAAGREQRRLSAELHDGLGQQLTGFALMAQGVAAAAKRGLPPKISDVEQLAEWASDAIATCRTIAHGLSPLNATSGDLIEALTALTGLYADAQGPDVGFAAIEAAPLRLSPAVNDHLYRIAQEGLSNALRHAWAQTIEMTLDVQPTLVRLEILDDGRGIPVGARDTPGLGLKLMHYRAAVIDARLFSVDTREGGGTRIVCECLQPR